MSAARGDRKPCTHNRCLGIMQFGREPLPQGPTMQAADGQRGWICSAKAEHFQLESEQRAAELVAKRCWSRLTPRPEFVA